MTKFHNGLVACPESALVLALLFQITCRYCDNEFS